jgi:hypothetical protein
LNGSDASFAFGAFQPSDIAIAGDWDGNGTDEIGYFRGGNTFLLDSDGDRVLNLASDSQITISVPSARPSVADYNGDGRSEIAVFSGDSFHIDSNNDGSLDTVRTFRSGQYPVAGNWT